MQTDEIIADLDMEADNPLTAAERLAAPYLRLSEFEVNNEGALKALPA